MAEIDNEHVTGIGWNRDDLLYTARCSCGADRRFLTWPLTLAWREEHSEVPADPGSNDAED